MFEDVLLSVEFSILGLSSHFVVGTKEEDYISIKFSDILNRRESELAFVGTKESIIGSFATLLILPCHRE